MAENGQGKVNLYSSASFSALPTEHYYKILMDTEPEKYSKFPAQNPVPGELYVFVTAEKEKIEDWKADGYSWRHMGPKKLPARDPKVWCHYASFGEFKRRGYTLFHPHQKYNFKTIVHYTGHINMEKRPHGNTRKHTRKFVPTAKSVLAKIGTHLNDNPLKTYRGLVNNEENIPAEYHPVLLPRNLKQVSNKVFNENNKSSLNNDEIYGLYTIDDEIEGFIKDYRLKPEFFCVLYSKKSLEIFEEISNFNSCILFYDTTFNIGDYFLSVFSYAHPIFDNKPTIPLAYLIHHRKTEQIHTLFFDHMKLNSEKLINKVIVTDRERAINNAIKNVLPYNINVYCWNHIIRDTEYWLKKQKEVTDEDIQTKKSHIWNLLDSTSLDEFYDRWEVMTAQWSARFLDYAKNHLYEAIKQCGRWVLETLEIYTPRSGITINRAESFNAVLKRCTVAGGKQMKAQILALTLYNLDLFYQREIIRGRAHMGNYILSKEFENFKLALEDCVFPSKNINIDNLPMAFAEGYQSKAVDNSDDKELPCTTYSLGKMLVLQGKIHHVPEKHVFIVSGESNKNYLVSLYPKETCTCIINKNCHHIQAVKISIGDERQMHKQVKLSKIMRKRRGFKSGKKGYPPNKLTVVEAASDSSAAQLLKDGSDTTILLPTIYNKKIKQRFIAPFSDSDGTKSVPHHQISSMTDTQSMNDLMAKTAVSFEPMFASTPNIKHKTVTINDQSNGDSPNGVYYSFHGRGIYEQHLQPLKFKKESDCEDVHDLYLYDDVVDIALAILCEKCRVQCHAVEGFLLSQSPFQHILLNFLHDDVPEKDIAFFPTCINSHFFLLVAIPQQKLVIYLDSKQSYLKFSTAVLDKLELLFATYLTYHQMKKTHFDASEWRIVWLENTPQQTNSYDCGVFTVLFAQTITHENKRLEKFVKNTFAYRKFISELIEGKVSENVSLPSSTRKKFDKNTLPDEQPDILIPEITSLYKGDSIFPYLANIISNIQKL